MLAGVGVMGERKGLDHLVQIKTLKAEIDTSKCRTC